MDVSAVRATLTDLPTAFLRQPGGWFDQLMDALSFETALGTLGTDDTVTQVQSFTDAQDGWLDIWGMLAGLPRNANEGNAPYATRINQTITAWVGTLPAIQMWLNLFAPGGTVADNQSGMGYTISTPAGMTVAQINTFLASLDRIRPAGMPFSVYQNVGGLYLGTSEFTGTGTVMGAYLTAGTSTLPLQLSPFTNSMGPLLPDLYFIAPILNPSMNPPAAPVPVA